MEHIRGDDLYPLQPLHGQRSDVVRRIAAPGRDSLATLARTLDPMALAALDCRRIRNKVNAND